MLAVLYCNNALSFQTLDVDFKTTGIYLQRNLLCKGKTKQF